MKNILKKSAILLSSLLYFNSFVFADTDSNKKDIVFIIVDDLNTWIGAMGGHPQTKTPNLDALATRGVLFTNAHCNAPQCGPSRKSFLTGLYPKSTGKYFNVAKKMPFFKDQPLKGATSKNPPKKPLDFHTHFMKNNYRVVSGGKVDHGSLKAKIDNKFDRPKEVKHFTDKRVNLWGEGGPQNIDDTMTGDYKTAQWAIKQWNTKSDKPLLMSVGFYRPHRPFNVPKEYFDKFPLESIQLPKVPEFDDLADLPEYGKALARSNAHKNLFKPRTVHEHILHLGGEDEWKYMVQSYLACINYVDTQIGLFLETLKNNPRGNDTVIILTSDHGWDLGEKEHWCKAALWRTTTRVPYIVVAPGLTQAGTVNQQPISHVDIYPTLCDFAGIAKPKHLEGQSILPLVKDSSAKREAAYLSYGPRNTAVQTERYRYISYEDGSGELYDHQKDPREWTNLSSNPEYAELKAKMIQKVKKFENN
ncbi:iduronate-sulfatase and sulfatase 1 precursor [Lentisphaera araneosa HTCC2155]|uniref:Iduronate-sulfatase and sulfatase 1 n=1 Tax=Lentisphaera araneosa HTCC2155 TaxID=313628 RepID=A6DFB2_9BACT|nr:sulfatase [Lentisphaera araneosa]EDM29492.1 iduronate-sulfatase and sulfatase 1 precursor [Lentisphaera araneosa HTCC2155]